MFVGRYGVSFGAKRLDDSIPLWVLFLAVQLLDVVWALRRAAAPPLLMVLFAAYALFAAVVWWLADRPAARARAA